jgi:hypothetical protein
MRLVLARPRHGADGRQGRGGRLCAPRYTATKKATITVRDRTTPEFLESSILNGPHRPRHDAVISPGEVRYRALFENPFIGIRISSVAEGGASSRPTSPTAR